MSRTSTAELATDTAPRRFRAAPLPPEERRAAIIAATLPLLLAHGSAVTTRQIAEAAGIAEGTIFRVFPDLDTLIQATVDAAYDPAQVAKELTAIDPAMSFEHRLEEAVRILQKRLKSIWQLMSISGVPRPHGLHHAHSADRPDIAALVQLLEPYCGQLRQTPAAAAHLLRGFTLAGTHPALTAAAAPMTPAEIVSVLLDGIRSPQPGRDRC
jgi:AcrR family transcriptional regulator